MDTLRVHAEGGRDGFSAECRCGLRRGVLAGATNDDQQRGQYHEHSLHRVPRRSRTLASTPSRRKTQTSTVSSDSFTATSLVVTTAAVGVMLVTTGTWTLLTAGPSE